MKLAVVSDEIDRNFGRALQVGLELGIRRYEIRATTGGRWPNIADDEITAAVDLVRAHEVEVTALSPGFFKVECSDPVVEDQLTHGLDRIFAIGERLDVRQHIVFSFRKPKAAADDVAALPEAVTELLARAADRAAQCGHRLLLENEHVCWGDTGHRAAAILRRIDSPALRLNWDPGNSAAAGGCPFPQEYEQLSDLVANVHMKNWRPTSDGGQWSPLDEGVIDWNGQLRALEADGYDGCLTIENHCGPAVSVTRRNAAFARTVLAGLQSSS